MKKYKDLKIGDIIDTVKITDIEKDDWHITITYDIISGGWSFLVIYPCDYNKEAKFIFSKNSDEENDQIDFLNELTEEI